MGILFSKLFEGLFGPKETKILMLGLDGAGKTTILYKLKFNKAVAILPTIGFNIETVQYKNISFTVWDIGVPRQFSRYYCTNTQGIIFVIDTNERLRINDAKEELMHLLQEDELRNAVLLVFANKQDLPHAMNAFELSEALGLNNLRNRNWFIQSTCATNGDGLYDGLDWLSRELKKVTDGQSEAI